MSDGMIQYHPGRIGDWTANTASCAARFDNIAQEVTARVAGMQEYFNTSSGSVSFTEAQQRINSGIDAVHQVFQRHSSTVDSGLSDFGATDAAAGSAFGSV